MDVRSTFYNPRLDLFQLMIFTCRKWVASYATGQPMESQEAQRGKSPSVGEDSSHEKPNEGHTAVDMEKS